MERLSDSPRISSNTARTLFRHSSVSSGTTRPSTMSCRLVARILRTSSQSPHPRTAASPAAGIDCGTGGSTCQVPLASASHVTLTAVPDFGYVFMGWTGDCTGGLTTSVHVNGPKACSALFEPLVSSSPRTVLYWDSQPGDCIGQGAKAVYSPANSQWLLTASSDGSRIDAGIADGTDYWRLSFSGPAGQPLAIGYHSAARRIPFTPFNGLGVSGSGRGCNTLTGRFVVLEIVLGLNGTVQRFAADFEQHCEDGVPALFGAIRYNSTIDEVVPFGGAYPSYQLLLTRPAHGLISWHRSQLRRCRHAMSTDALDGRTGRADGNAGLRIHVHGLDRRLQRGRCHDLARQWSEAVRRQLRTDRRRRSADAPALGQSRWQLHRAGPERSALVGQQPLDGEFVPDRQHGRIPGRQRGPKRGFELDAAVSGAHRRGSAGGPAISWSPRLREPGSAVPRDLRERALLRWRRVHRSRAVTRSPGHGPQVRRRLRAQLRLGVRTAVDRFATGTTPVSTYRQRRCPSILPRFVLPRFTTGRASLCSPLRRRFD